MPQQALQSHAFKESANLQNIIPGLDKSPTSVLYWTVNYQCAWHTDKDFGQLNTNTRIY